MSLINYRRRNARWHGASQKVGQSADPLFLDRIELHHESGIAQLVRHLCAKALPHLQHHTHIHLDSPQLAPSPKLWNQQSGIRNPCESWQNSSSTTYFAHEVYLSLPMKYYFYRQCSTTSFFSCPFNEVKWPDEFFITYDEHLCCFIVQSSIHYTNLQDPSASILYFLLTASCTTLNDKCG